ncbi:hypothetical protein NQ315_003504 [Exocentrus adspersus]|uniref:MADF domain-containing protein n=1 Tax=Exocentrus adspersus TaxID=1586481 RepID=A0AAV8V7S1_9CUCU|nr:hypothetical protein NQ315_003504 [Exocentrus adspersus]
MSETENLILAVEKYPCLWDIRNEDYHNRDMKELAWQQVCLEMYKDWECQSATEKLNKYMLHFLTPVFNSRRSQGNYTDESSQQEQLESQENSSETQVATDTTEVENIVRSPSPPVTVTNKKRKQDVPTQILGLLQKRNQQIKPSKEEDDDTKFLLSFRNLR